MVTHHKAHEYNIQWKLLSLILYEDLKHIVGDYNLILVLSYCCVLGGKNTCPLSQ